METTFGTEPYRAHRHTNDGGPTTRARPRSREPGRPRFGPTQAEPGASGPTAGLVHDCMERRRGPGRHRLRHRRRPWSVSGSTPTSRSCRAQSCCGGWPRSATASSCPRRPSTGALRIIAGTFFALAAGVSLESVRKLATGEHPCSSVPGVALTVVSPVVMPRLARAKRKVGRQLSSLALQADATKTVLCVWLSAIVLAGLSMLPSGGGGPTRSPLWRSSTSPWVKAVRRGGATPAADAGELRGGWPACTPRKAG